MMHSLSQSGIGLGSSPGQGHFGTPGSSALHGLGVEMGSGLTPSLYASGGIPTPELQQAMAGNMNFSVSEIMGTGRKRNEDEERNAKMGSIMKKIGKTTGRVTTDGIQRVAKRVGLNAPGYDESASEIVMAGPAEKMMVIVKMQGDIVRSIAPEIFICESGKEPEEQAMGQAASKVLKQDLTVSNGILLQSSLDNFATSLDRLARMDRLSKGQVDCFEAINGLHTSLKKLYELEKSAVKALRELKGDDADERAEREVLRKRSGKPSIHNGKIGLSLDYWTSSPEDAEEQEGDKIWSLRIEAQKCLAGTYQSLRVSDAWLPDTFDLPPPENQHDLPWQNPPNTLISINAAAAGSDAMAIDGGEQLPDLRFVAKLDPPLLLPLQTAAAILAILGDEITLTNPNYPIYHLHLLGIKSRDSTLKVMSETKVLLRDGETQSLHEYVLDVSKADFCYILEEVPFAHPRELVELLPVLRQWASVSKILKHTFQHPQTTHDVPTRQLAATSLDDMLAEVDDQTKQEKVRIDVTFASNASTIPTMARPSFSLTYSATTEGGTNDVVFQVLPNGEIVVSECGVAEDDEAKKTKSAKVLHAWEDAGMWVEWLREQN